MTKCSKCGGRMSRPRYVPPVHVFGILARSESLRFLCVECGYVDYAPTHDTESDQDKHRRLLAGEATP